MLDWILALLALVGEWVFTGNRIWTVTVFYILFIPVTLSFFVFCTSIIESIKQCFIVSWEVGKLTNDIVFQIKNGVIYIIEILIDKFS